jgi:pimeloyl-ACP methyl ester carboxylesterase
VLLLKEYALAKGLQIIGMDRPGVGLSTFFPHMSITNVVNDVTYLADQLRIDEFSLSGHAAGGPYAITYAAMHPDRVTNTLVISGISLPIETADMSRASKRLWEMSMKPLIGPRIAMEIRDQLLDRADHPDAFLETAEGKQLLEDPTTRDEARLLWSPGTVRDVFLRASGESVRQRNLCTQVWIQEAKLFRKTWHVDITRIPEGRVVLAHGAADRHVPIHHAHRTAQAIPGAQLRVFENSGHGLLYSHFTELFDGLT